MSCCPPTADTVPDTDTETGTETGTEAGTEAGTADPGLGAAVSATLRFVRAFGLVERDTVCCGDVTVAQCICLQALAEGPRELVDLAGIVGTSRPATTRMVDTLARKGWAHRTRDAQDRRRVWIGLSAAGQAQAADLHARTEALLQAILARIPEDERAGVVAALDTLATAAQGLRCC